MRKTLYAALALILLFVGCQKNSPKESIKASSRIAQRSCASNDVLEQQLASDPSMRERISKLEAFTQRIITTNQVNRINGGQDIVIPVIVHVLAKTEQENISDAQIKSQIDVLNEDFNLKNRDASAIPSVFSGLKADIGIQFVLSKVIRKATTKNNWAPNDNMKKTAQGGSDPIDPAHNLNIWVCNLGQSLLGYSSFPNYPPSVDGVVILYSAFGRTGTLIPDYNKGRTATHEIGHWMNLRHIWGDATCGSDFVDDTPLHTTYNFNCPPFPHMSTCGPNIVEMTMNYMDYTDDACMFMFTGGQKNRMLAIFSAGGPRASFVQ